jgi:undecaprenyl-diphosphatase
LTTQQVLVTVVLGIVEGVTEFLPISSTGHLDLAGHFLDFENLVGKRFAESFYVIIQLGAVLAIVAAYPNRMTRLLRVRDSRGFSGPRGLWLLFLTTVPAGLLALAARAYIQAKLLHPIPIAIALAVGAVWILIVERRLPKTRVETVDEITWKSALGVGFFQCLALWPGMSRSASTILGGMMLGLDRKAAVEYSFFSAIPIMVAATFYELYKMRDTLDTRHLELAAIGFVVSFLSAWVAVRLFIRLVSHHTLTPFAWYRLALAATVLVIMLR